MALNVRYEDTTVNTRWPLNPHAEVLVYVEVYEIFIKSSVIWSVIMGGF